MQEVTTITSPQLSTPIMLDFIRQHGIDIIPIIQEELNEFIPAYIEQLVRNIYTHYLGEVQ